MDPAAPVTPVRRRAVVFAYHNVGVRCLRVLLDGGVDVALVVTHQDSSSENIWFGSVAELARSEGIAFITPEDPNQPAIVDQIAALGPDFIFSFYYRQMLSEKLLAIPAHGALNMHGSLLPKYRGRAPVNWAVLHGETRTGASLHYMVAKPDAGNLVAQAEVPILINDTAGEVFEKVTVAAELTLWKVLPNLLALNAPGVPLDLENGSYFGGRKPEDGRIDWRLGAAAVHNLVRAVAPPYPGAWFELAGLRFELHETRQRQLAGGMLGDLPIYSVLPSDPRQADAASAIHAALLIDGDQLLAVWPATKPAAPDALSPSAALDGAAAVARPDPLSRLAPIALSLRELRHNGQPCAPARLRELLSVGDARALIALHENG